MQNNKRVVLCVDDDPDILSWLRIVLERNGYAVTGVSSAGAAKKVLETSVPDFMIVDLMMEEIDAGTRLVSDVREQGYTGPIYMLSSSGDELASFTDYAALGLDGVFQKPLEAEALLKVVRERLGQ